MGELFKSDEKLNILSDFQVGFWRLESSKGMPMKMFGDENMNMLIGTDMDMDPVERCEFFISRIHPDDHEIFLEYENNLERKHKAEVTYKYNHPTLGTMIIRCGGKREFDGKGNSVTRGYHQEITNIIRSESQLKELYKQIMYALGSDYEAIHYADLDAGTFSTIRSSQLMLDRKIETISADYDDITQDMIKTTVVPGQLDEFLSIVNSKNLKEKIGTEENFSYRYMVNKENNEKSTYEMRFVKVGDNPNEHGVVMAARCIDDIVSEERELEKALEEAKRANRAKGEFLSRMSHDIRTPLNGIIGILNLDEAHKDDLELINANRNKAQRAANHLLSLLNDVLDMSKLEYENTELLKEEFDIYELCVDILTIGSIRANDNGITLYHDSGKNLKYHNVIGSSAHVRQVLMNILTNGIKYNNQGGSITVSSKIAKLDQNRVFYEFTVSDTGIGMSEEFLKHLFEPFTQERNDARSRYQGTGLGMAIVKALIDKMEGTIEVKSKPTEGSTFIVTIPFEIADENTAVNTRGRKESKSVEGMNVLLVEDNDLNMEIAKYILEDSKVNVYMATNGEMAYNMYVNSPAGKYDAILMDIMMPKMNGYDATRLIRKSDKKDATVIPIIAMTANAFAEDVKKAKDCGMNEHIAKPINAAELIYTLGIFRR